MGLVLRVLVIAIVVLGLSWSEAAAQGNGAGFHVAATGDLNCPGGQTVSLPAPPNLLGPITIPCTSGQGIAAAEAAATLLRAFGRSEHACCGTASGGNGSARIQVDNVVITGPPAASIPVSVNFHLRGTVTGNASFGQNRLTVFVRLSFLSSFSQLETNELGVVNQTGVFAPLVVGFPQAAIDSAFTTHVANVAPNQPLLFEIQLLAGAAMAGEGFTETDVFSGSNGFFLPFGVPVFNLPPGYTITIPELNIVNNYVGLPALFSGDIFVVGSNASEISLPGVNQVTGSVSVSDNGTATVINLSDLDSAGGSVIVDDNGSATTIDLSSLDSAGESVNIDDNGSATTINLSELDSVGGSIRIDGNTSANVVDLASLLTAGGDVSIANNGACTTVTMGMLATVAGDLIVETCGTGTFTPGPVAPGGDATLRTTGYTVVSATTATGSTTVTTGTSDAFMTVQLPAGTFTAPVPFTITELDPATLTPEDGIGAIGEPVTIDPIAAYQLTFGVPTLNANASLTFDVVVANLDTATAGALLEALAAGTATLVTRSDAPETPYQAFPICDPGESATPGGCVVVQLLDSNGQPTTETPAIVRFSNVVGHFSIWAVAMVTPDDAPPAFAFAGLLAPYPAPPLTTTPTFKRGSVVPLKFAWTDTTGAVVDSAAAAPTIAIYTTSCTEQAPTTQPITPDDAGESGGLRYDATTGSWILNWSTKGLAVGCFAIEVTPGDAVFGAPPNTFSIALRDR